MVKATLLELQPEAESSARSTRHFTWIIGGWEGHSKGDRMFANYIQPASLSELPQMNGGQGRKEHLKASPLCLAENAGLPVQVSQNDNLYGNGVAIVPKRPSCNGRGNRKDIGR